MSASVPPMTVEEELDIHPRFLIDERELEDACRECDIYVYSDADPVIATIQAIDEEFMDLPYTNIQHDNDPMTLSDEDNRVTIVYIRGFFTNRRDLVYYVRGQRVLAKFNSGVYGRQCFVGPMSGTPVFSSNLYPSFMSITPVGPKKVNRLDSQMQRVRWRYYFEAGRVLWSRIQIDPDKIKEFNKQAATNSQHSGD
ncbi:hypothetical protein EK21DRAFT_107800 [Setomelanomma holmii]|uniref:Uncharacterized protein n=1 Tax=Setomelanomma holmii TaxID=210430 RepID=A0A9P4HKH9_9PLEO|nr:hypothetical protein EK21DRAFT_107800 [Setomelanomma holmii]